MSILDLRDFGVGGRFGVTVLPETEGSRLLRERQKHLETRGFYRCRISVLDTGVYRFV